MYNAYFKFPTTPHLADIGTNLFRSDKVLNEEERNFFLRHEIYVEEKVDGANLGISFDFNGKLLVQNRGEFIHPPYVGQWKKLSEWLASRVDLLFDTLADRYILFGEWCYAQHTISYTSLPDWFLAFDIYDKKIEQFFTLPQRNLFLVNMQIYHVPFIKKGKFTLNELIQSIGQSQLGDGLAEGVYLRLDAPSKLQNRAKLVHPQFNQKVATHWTKQKIKPNRIDYTKYEYSHNLTY